MAPSTGAATGAASGTLSSLLPIFLLLTRMCRVSCAVCVVFRVPAAPSHLSHLSPQLQAYFQDTPRASDPEAIFADHTPVSGELSQVTQLNHDVAPEVNVELVLSQVRSTAQPHTPQLSGVSGLTGNRGDEIPGFGPGDARHPELDARL